MENWVLQLIISLNKEHVFSPLRSFIANAEYNSCHHKHAHLFWEEANTTCVPVLVFRRLHWHCEQSSPVLHTLVIQPQWSTIANQASFHNRVPMLLSKQITGRKRTVLAQDFEQYSQGTQWDTRTVSCMVKCSCLKSKSSHQNANSYLKFPSLYIQKV